MPRLTRRQPKYCHHKASGQAVVTICGRDVYLGRFGSPESKAAYDEAIANWKSDGDEPQLANTTVSQLCLAYFRHAKQFYQRDGKETAEVAAIRSVLKRFRRRYGDVLTAHIRPKHVRHIIDRMAAAELSRSYCNQALGRLKRMFVWGVERDLAPGSVARDVGLMANLAAEKSKAKEPRIVGPVNESTVDATLPYLPEVVGDLVRVLQATGARPSEIFQLRRCDIDRTKEPWVYQPERHKNTSKGKSRVILFGPRARAVVLKYLVGPADGLVFERPEGGAFKRWNLHQFVQNACTKAKVEAWFPYQLRHSAGTAARREADLEAAQVMLGHSRRATTERYAEVDTRRGAALVEKIG